MDFNLFSSLIRTVSLIHDFCPSDQWFASGFLQIPSHNGHPCLVGYSLNPSPLEDAAQPPERKRKEATDAYSVYEEIIKDNIEYDYLIQDRYLDRDRIEEILALILETVCTKRKTIRIAGDDYPAELVKARFMKLNSEHIRFVLDCMQENTTKIRNIKQYMKAALFNAPSTIGSYYTSLVSHDMADGTFYGKPKKSGIPDYTCNEGESL